MTAKELITKLKKIPENTRIVISGYEGGYHDLKGNLDEIEVVLDYNTEWYYGPHEPVNEYDKERYKNHTIMNVVEIS